jgi:hypothetical protein
MILTGWGCCGQKYSLPNDESANNFAGISLVRRLVVMIAERYRSDTVAALACPKMSDLRLRDMVWRLKNFDTGTHLCVAPTLLDVAGLRTRFSPVARRQCCIWITQSSAGCRG